MNPEVQSPLTKKRKTESESKVIAPETEKSDLLSATDIDENTNIILLKYGSEYCKHKYFSEDDPIFILHLYPIVIENIFNDLTNGIIAGLPTIIPNHLDMANKQAFSDSIYEVLRNAGGGQRFMNIIGPNNLEQYGNIINMLAQIEVEPYMQALRAHSATPLGICANISDGKDISPVQIHRLQLPY